ncbi:hypothetical protein D3C85_1507550 [compost metagenome]
MFEQEFTDDFRDLEVTDLIAVSGFHRNIHHDGAHGVQAEQNVGLEKVALADLVQG